MVGIVAQVVCIGEESPSREESPTLCVFSTALLQKCACLILEFYVHVKLYIRTYMHCLFPDFILPVLNICVCCTMLTLVCVQMHNYIFLLPLTGLTRYHLDSCPSVFCYFLLTCSSNVRIPPYSGISMLFLLIVRTSIQLMNSMNVHIWLKHSVHVLVVMAHQDFPEIFYRICTTCINRAILVLHLKCKNAIMEMETVDIMHVLIYTILCTVSCNSVTCCCVNTKFTHIKHQN